MIHNLGEMNGSVKNDYLENSNNVTHDFANKALQIYTSPTFNHIIF